MTEWRCSFFKLILPMQPQLIIASLHGQYHTHENGIQHGSTPVRDCWKCKINFNFKQSTKGPSSGNFLMINGCFSNVISHVKALGWLEKKKEGMIEEEDEQILNFDHFRLARLE